MKNKILIITSRYYPSIAAALEAGATEALGAAGHDFDIIEVPGALEIPAAISMAAKTKKYAGYVALGCVVRGETSHYDIVAGESARGLSELAIRQHLPIGNAILTVENQQQALHRADVKAGNKGGFATHAMLAMLKLKTDWNV